MHHSLRVAGLAAALALVPSSAQAAPTAYAKATADKSAAPSELKPIGKNTVLQLDSSRTTPLGTDGYLQSRTTYTVEVEGVVSYLNQSLWDNPAGSYWVTCGSTARVTRDGAGVGGIDPEFLFAGVARRGCGNFKPPFVDNHFEISTGDAFFNPVPVGGQPEAPSSDHAYTYSVRGIGEPIEFKLIDSQYADNKGKYKITITEVPRPIDQ